MNVLTKRGSAVGILVTGTCLGVFLLPFLLPPHPILGVSAANAAGFNNKIAAISAALMSMVAFLWHLKQGDASDRTLVDSRPLPGWLMPATALLTAILSSAVSIALFFSDGMFQDDLDYFINRISQHTQHGRILYDQIEFPYGPLLFGWPIAVQKLLWPLHLSVRASYLIALSLAYVAGIVLLWYVINSLRMSRGWKIFAFVGLALQTVQLNMGLNYTLFRFLVVSASLIFASQRKTNRSVALCLCLGQLLCLATSPEMGFAYLAGALTYAGYRVVRARGRDHWGEVAAPPAATLLFFLAAAVSSGAGYVRMLGLFSRGIFNLIVQPVPYVFIFLIALVGLVPFLLAKSVQRDSPDASLLCGLYVAALALLPVAFGRADPAHVLLNGMGIYLLSFVAVSSMRNSAQAAWGLAVAYVFLFTLAVTIPNSRYVFRPNVRAGVMRLPGISQAAALLPPKFRQDMQTGKRAAPPPDINTLRTLTGGAPMVTPVTTSRLVQDELENAGLLQPTFYFFQFAVLDREAEEREIKELNQSEWALLPQGLRVISKETPESRLPIGSPQYHYRARRKPYVTGSLFHQNLARMWQPVATLNGYVLYHRRSF